MRAVATVARAIAAAARAMAAVARAMAAVARAMAAVARARAHRAFMLVDHEARGKQALQLLGVDRVVHEERV